MLVNFEFIKKTRKIRTCAQACNFKNNLEFQLTKEQNLKLGIIREPGMAAFSKLTVLIAAAAILSSAGSAIGQPPAAPAYDTPPDWLTRPTASQLMAAYPVNAVAWYLSGMARIRCIVQVSGELAGCAAVSETPLESGFAAAALKLTPVIRMKPALKDGKPMETSIVIPIGFSMPAPSTIQNPEWLKTPSANEMTRLWPAKAAAAGKGGNAKVNCVVAEDGLLRDCVIASESPEGLGFGPAALAATPMFLMKPQTRDGKPVGGAHVIIPINFRCDGPCTPFGSGMVTRIYRTVPWVSAPTAAEIAAVYPDQAKKHEVELGQVALRCEFSNKGKLQNCQSAGESPEGQGFEAAARKLVGYFQAPEKDQEGRSFGGAQVRINFAFPRQLLTNPAKITGSVTVVEAIDTDQIGAAFPGQAKADNITYGEARLSCAVQSDGQLAACEVKSESPSNEGFGGAALSLMDKVRVRPWGDDGLPTVGATLNMTVPFGEPPETAARLRAKIMKELNPADIDKAWTDAQRLYANYPLTPDGLAPLMGISSVYESMNQYDKSLEVLDRVIQLYPGGAPPFNEKCWRKAIHGVGLDTAMLDCDHGLRIAPQNAQLLDSRGFLNLKLKDNKAALADYDAANALSPNSASTLYGRGLAKIRMGNKAAGTADISAAKKLNERIADDFVRYGVPS